MKMVLLKDLVIPAGTVFKDAPIKTERASGHIEAIIATSKNTCAFVTIDPTDCEDELSTLFADLR